MMLRKPVHLPQGLSSYLKPTVQIFADHLQTLEESELDTGASTHTQIIYRFARKMSIDYSVFSYIFGILTRSDRFKASYLYIIPTATSSTLSLSTNCSAIFSAKSMDTPMPRPVMILSDFSTEFRETIAPNRCPSKVG